MISRIRVGELGRPRSKLHRPAREFRVRRQAGSKLERGIKCLPHAYGFHSHNQFQRGNRVCRGICKLKAQDSLCNGSAPRPQRSTIRSPRGQPLNLNCRRTLSPSVKSFRSVGFSKSCVDRCHPYRRFNYNGCTFPTEGETLSGWKGNQGSRPSLSP